MYSFYVLVAKYVPTYAIVLTKSNRPTECAQIPVLPFSLRHLVNLEWVLHWERTATVT